MSQRSYRQICGLARALDVVGERWTLLVIRELLLGPKRFGALKDALPGISANLLSARLRSLEEAGIIERVELPAPASGVYAYALTERGEGLRDAAESLALWGMDLVEPERQHEEGHLARPSLYAGTRMAAAKRGGALEGLPPLTVDCEIDGDAFVIASDGEGSGGVRHGSSPDPDARLTCELPRFYALLSEGLELDGSDPREAEARAAAPLLAALAEKQPVR